MDIEHGYVPKKPYICCVTAYTESNLLRRAASGGVDSFLTKPISLEEVKMMVKRAL